MDTAQLESLLQEMQRDWSLPKHRQEEPRNLHSERVDFERLLAGSVGLKGAAGLGPVVHMAMPDTGCFVVVVDDDAARTTDLDVLVQGTPDQASAVAAGLSQLELLLRD